jgi:hypothetical protein
LILFILYYYYLYYYNLYTISCSFWIISICIISICILKPSFSLDINYFNLVHENVKDYWRMQGVGRGRITIVCHSHLLWILKSRFKIWGMIFLYIMRQNWCCLYQSPQTIWLGMCQCILKFGSWIVQRVSGCMQMHVYQFGFTQFG